MAWTRASIKGNNSVEPVSRNKQGSGLSIAGSGVSIHDNPEEPNESVHTYSGPKKSTPGAFKLNQLTGVRFNDSDWDAITGKWSEDKISKWFRDDGNTTT